MANKLKKFTVSRRFEVWVEEEISAPDFQTAVTEAQAMDATDFMKFNRTPLDFTSLPGTAVSESI